jgi:GTP-binding protein HflX
LHPSFKKQAAQTGYRSDTERLAEAEKLTRAIDIDVQHAQILPLAKISPSHFIGKGQLQTLVEKAHEDKPDVIIINAPLSPIQQRNLERAIKTKVIDRTALILEIFGARAQTREGALQVELAHLSYQQGRLVRSWTHLERQRGGAGFLGGPGETQIETDRRLLRDKIQSLKARLEDVRRTRGLARRKRTRAPFPTVVLVGYTNAGKSTLFNRLTKAAVLSKDMLFATLDPTVRRVQLPSGSTVMFTDTVGFISDLPTELVASFRATLEEVQEADLVLHVQDVSSEDHLEQRGDVLAVLGNLGINPDIGEGPPILEVYNKVDQISLDEKESLINQSNRRADLVLLSAQTGEGVEELNSAIDEMLPDHSKFITWAIRHERGAAVATAYRMGRNVMQISSDEAKTLISGDFTDQAVARLLADGAEIKA